MIRNNLNGFPNTLWFGVPILLLSFFNFLFMK